MDIESAKRVLLNTHLAALEHGVRANGAHLVSGPGVGKSDSQRQYCAALAKHLNQPVGLVPFMLATITSADVRGFMIPVPRKDKEGRPTTPETVFSTPPWYPTRAVVEVVTPEGEWFGPGEWEHDLPTVGVLFLDEFSQAEDEVKKPAAELVYKGHVGTCSLPIGYRVVSAGNRTSDRSGVMRELMFIVNRRLELKIDAMVAPWLNYVTALPQQHRPHYLTISFAQKNPDIVFKDAVPEGTDPFCTPRTLCLMDADLRALRTPQDVARDRLPTDGTAREVAAGWIGPASAAQFFTHVKYADELPDIADVVKDPRKAKLPPNMDAQMVCGYMLAHHVTEKNAAPVMHYIERLQIEMQLLAIRAISQDTERAKAIVSQREYSDWLIKNKDLITKARA